MRLPDAPRPHPERLEQYGGIAVAPDGTLRVARTGVLSALSPDGDLVWSHLLREGMSITERHAAPVALDNGHTLLTLAHIYTVVDAAGKVRRQVAWEPFDDSGMAPSFTRDGRLIATSIQGEIAVALDGDWHTVGEEFGYDILPPAVYDDGSLAVAGYYGSGFCRVTLDGDYLWQSGLRDADLLPTVNRRQFAAVGSLNEQLSVLYSPEGDEVGEYGAAAIFAEYSANEWIARSEGMLARLDRDWEPLWELPILSADRWSRVQPIVDGQGRIYVADAEGVHCVSGSGDTLFTVPTDSGPISLALVAPGRAAALVDRDLLLIE